MSGIEVLAVMSAVMTAVGTAEAGKAQSNQAKHNAQINEYNAKVSENNAVAARQTAAENKRRFDKQTAHRMGKMRATGGANLSLDLLEASAMEEELEALSILHAGEMQAQGFEQQALISRQTAGLRRAQGSAALSAGFTGAAGSLLKGAGSSLDLGDT